MTDVSIRDVARLAEVSIATVSRCVNDPEKVAESTRRKVQVAIEATGYVPNSIAQSFRRGRTNLIVVTMPEAGNPYVSELLSGIHQVAQERGYGVMIEEVGPDAMNAEQVAATLTRNRADGILLLASICSEVATDIEQRLARSVRVVSGHRRQFGKDSRIPSVTIDNEQAAMDAVSYLIDRGHEHIALLSGPQRLGFVTDREAGFHAAMGRNKLAVRDEWIINTDLTIESAADATLQLLIDSQHPTAIFCVSDEIAIGAMHAVTTRGLAVPDDVSIIGFDDMRFAAASNPPLTTVRQPGRDIGKQMMERLCHDIEHGPQDDCEPVLVAHELVIRSSVSKPPD